MRKYIDGKKYSLELKNELKEKVEKLEIKPTLVVISVGDNEASKVYVGQKEKAAKYIGMNYKHVHYDDIEEEELEKEIIKLNKKKDVDGIIVQLPLPKKFNEQRIVNLIDEDKDVDGLTFINAGKLLNKEDCLTSCTPEGIMYLLKKEKIDLEGKNCVVLGRSILVGKPIFNLLVNANATVTLCHSKTKNIKEITKHADVLVVAIGKKHFVTRDMVKKGAIVIDVGINRENKKIYGDVNTDDCYDKVKKITPVPGGVGPMTVAMLMNNVLKSYEKRRLK